MDVSNGALNTQAVTLADGAGATGVVMAVVGVILVAMLIGAVWLGKRRREQELPPPRPEEQPVAPEHRSHVEEHDVHGDDSFPADGRGLSPYELGEHTRESTRRENDEQRD
ncbi:MULTISPECIES: DUF6479 family protein [unclassified Streptomyces]|uniref:DUF6479 family protein n=1 Tax=unclassified Streptomyces TaxID=2593676 RepID=UPI002034381A|nr:DUF6479 family protein [Streptomyces sp. RKAG290]MCM2415847.1 DUF6479 family protein [Streptomyces sp. RKAG290]